ncbi:putative inactive poly [ADP-ribose] polymerase SRO1 [Tasmannia lanceolata]|uniref:putative inactive poly [ADP-ribose] polymerase SRO1 n=1 Tax=Tasmannia lanceolata TaxID=3420 RepID=UPI0040632B32
MKPEGGNYVLATAKKRNPYAAKLVQKRKKKALGRGRSVNRQYPQPHSKAKANHSLPPSCLAFLQNQANFEKSDIPSKIMFFLNGNWTDFPPETFEILKRAFVSRNPSVVFEFDGSTQLLDFLRMLQIDLTSGHERSVAWIDVKGKCFFPKVFVGGDSGFDSESPLELKIVVNIENSKVVQVKTNVQSENKGCEGREIDQIVRREIGGELGNLGYSRKVKEIDQIVRREIEGELGNLGNSRKVKEIAVRIPDLNEKEVTEVEEIAPPHLCLNDNEAVNDNSAEIAARMVSKDKEVVDDNVNEVAARLMYLKRNGATNGISANVVQDMEVTAHQVLKENEVGDGNFVSTDKGNKSQERLDNVADKVAIELRCNGESSNLGERKLECTISPSDKASDEMLDSSKRVCLSGSPELGMSCRKSRFDSMGRDLAKLSENDEAYIAVMNMFLRGMLKIDTGVKVREIYCCSHASSTGSARLRVFDKLVEMTKATRGDANIRYGWYGTSPKVVESIVLHGFGQVEARSRAKGYGIGLYLSPEGDSHSSASQSEPDDNETFYVVLCRAIMGNMEQIEMGSHQCHPSNKGFDSGVDDLIDPKCYVIWSTRVNTHILPEYVVGFAVSEHLQELPRRRNGELKSTNLPHSCGSPIESPRSVPSPVHAVLPTAHPPSMDTQIQSRIRLPSPGLAPNMSFPALFSLLRNHLPESSMETLEDGYNEYKASRIAKDDLVQRIRLTVGDDLLIRAIQCIRRSGSSHGNSLSAKQG